jgi:membrane-associated phospholipid phosphatase
MELLLQWGLDFIRTIQSAAGPGLTVFMKLITNFGAAPVYLLLLSLIFWCYDEKKGLRLGLALMVSFWLNLAFKFLLHQPRPFWEAYDPSVGMIRENLHGLPSGHAQLSLTFWIIVASWGKRKWLYCAAILFCLLIGFSRIYLGVHFPTDLLGGWFLGALVVTVYFLLGDRLEAVLIRGGFRLQLIVSAAAAFIMILYNPETARETPNGIQALVTPGGAFLGMGCGYSLTARFFRFKAAVAGGNRGARKFLTLLCRSALGIAGMVLVLWILRFIIPGDEGFPNYRLFVFLQFVFLGLWVYTGAPWLFLQIGLAQRDETPK